MNWPAPIFIDRNGTMWELTGDGPRIITQEMLDAEFELTDGDKEFLAELKVAI